MNEANLPKKDKEEQAESRKQDDPGVPLNSENVDQHNLKTTHKESESATKSEIQEKKKAQDELKLKEKEERKKMEREKEAEKKKLESQEKEAKNAMEAEKETREKADKEREKDNKERVKKMESELRTKGKRKPFKLPLWLRLFNLIIGAALIGITSFVIVDSDLTLSNMINILTGLLVLLGALRVVNAFYDKDLSGNKRLLTFVVGSGLVLLGISSYVIPDIGKDIIVMILSAALIIQGISRVFLGLFNDVFPAWYRGMIFAAGVLSILIPTYILYDQDFENKNVIRLLAYTFFFFGIARIGRAMTGLGTKRKN